MYILFLYQRDIIHVLMSASPVYAAYIPNIPDHIPYFRQEFPTRRMLTVPRDISCKLTYYYDVKIVMHRQILACTYSKEPITENVEVVISIAPEESVCIYVYLK